MCMVSSCLVVNIDGFMPGQFEFIPWQFELIPGHLRHKPISSCRCSLRRQRQGDGKLECLDSIVG